MNGLIHLEPDYSEFVEVDPTGRYGRYNEILGKGASKTVYRAFDEYEGIEVAWNQVKLNDFLQSPEDLERLYCEIHLLKTLKHKNIMKFYTSWVDTAKRNINFVTEMFTSGTLRQYRLKHKRVNIRAIKHWCRQILKGLLYLHCHDPPVIHRDLKCDNIFVNGNQGEVKIGDLGLAAILRNSHAAHCVGTPEFMAPEIYEEEYNELVDIYSFGMCILEMVTLEYPYSECTNPAQIYKKVISGRKPDALYKVKDPEVRQFIEKCLATASSRLSARELLNDPFLQIDDYDPDLRSIDYRREFDDLGPVIRQPLFDRQTSNSSYINGYSNGSSEYDSYSEWGHRQFEIETSGIELFEHHDDEHSPDVDIAIRGKRRDDGSIFLRLRITDKEGHVRNIYFPFDIEIDTALTVATEMVAELDIHDQDVTRIADMIDGELVSLVPEWKPGLGIEETPRFASMCHNCASNHTSVVSYLDFLSNNPGAHNLQFLGCCHGCAAAFHGRFEEITYQADGSEHHVTEHMAIMSSQLNGARDPELWDQRESLELSSMDSGLSHSDEEPYKVDQGSSVKDTTATENDSPDELNAKDFGKSNPSSFSTVHYFLSDDPDNGVQWEMRWLKAKYQLELREVRDQQLGIVLKSSSPHPDHGEQRPDSKFSPSSIMNPWLGDSKQTLSNSNRDLRSSFCNFSQNSETRRAQTCKAAKDWSNIQNMAAAKSFCIGSLLPNSLRRTTSLPVDAVYAQ